MTVTVWRSAAAAALAVLAWARPADAEGVLSGGFTGSYFANSSFAGTPSFSRRDVRIDFAWNGAPPGGSITPQVAAVSATRFSIRWTGQIVPDSSGSYTFGMALSGAGSFKIGPAGGSLTTLISHTGSDPTPVSGSYTVTAKTPYDVELDFSNAAQAAVASLLWNAPGGQPKPIEIATPLGVNINGLADWDGSRMLADAMKQSRGWAKFDDFTQPAPSDAQGWPTTDFLVIPIAGPPELNGTYRLSFRGKANVQLEFGYGSFAVGTTSYGGTLPSGAGYNAATNVTSALMTVTPADGVNLFMTFGNTQRTAASAVGSGLTQIKLMRPVTPGSTMSFGFADQFNTALKGAMAPFAAIRYMPYLGTNGTTDAHWADRTLPSAPIQAQPNGGALEAIVMFANETGKDVWINVPVSADDDYVTKLAQLFRFGSDGRLPYASAQANPKFPPLQPNLKLYVEYSNELWNFSFSQASTNLALANAEVSAGGSPLDFDQDDNQYYWGWRRIGERTKQISDIFRTVWGDSAMLTRVRPVIEWQGGDGQDTANQIMNFLADYFDNADGLTHVATPKPISSYIWGAGGNWYHSVVDENASTIDAIYRSGLVPPPGVVTDVAWAQTFGWPRPPMKAASRSAATVRRRCNWLPISIRGRAAWPLPAIRITSPTRCLGPDLQYRRRFGLWPRRSDDLRPVHAEDACGDPDRGTAATVTERAEPGRRHHEPVNKHGRHRA